MRIWTKSWIFAGLIALIVSASATAQPNFAHPNGALNFDVKRGNSDFGYHNLTFREEGDRLYVTTEVKLRAGLGPITVFRYDHQSEEIWENGQLISLQARTYKDDEWLSVNVYKEDDNLVVEGTRPGGETFTREAALDALPSSHWFGYPQETQSLINTETGEDMPVEITPLPQRNYDTARQSVPVSGLTMVGTLSVDLYYDEAGLWAGCQFEARGQSIRYIRQDVDDA